MGFDTYRSARMKSVAKWVKEYFGEHILTDTKERATRLLEEAIELAQAEDVDFGKALALVSHVYGRPAGKPEQEVGGIAVTLLAYCASKGIDLDKVEKEEIERIWSKDVNWFRQRHQRKTDAGIAEQAIKAEFPPANGRLDGHNV